MGAALACGTARAQDAEADAAFAAGYYAKAGIRYEEAYQETHDRRLLLGAMKAFARTSNGHAEAVRMAQAYRATARGAAQLAEARGWLTRLAGEVPSPEPEPNLMSAGIDWSQTLPALPRLRRVHADPSGPRQHVNDVGAGVGGVLVGVGGLAFLYGFGTIFWMSAGCDNVENPRSCWKSPAYVASFSSLMAGLGGLAIGVPLLVWGARERRPSTETVLVVGAGAADLRVSF